jgi:calcium-dependent protein kinase
MEEVSILNTLDHPNIVKMHDIFEDEKYIYIVMELLSGGEV